MDNNEQKKIDLSSPEEVQEAVKKNEGKPVHMNVYLLYGVYGELPGCEGLAEEVINTDEKLKKYGLDPAEGGTFIKLMGCSYLYKGDPATDKVKGIELAKRCVSVFPRRIIGRSVVLTAALGFLYIFFPKRFWDYACIFAEEIKMKTIGIYGIPEERYNKAEKEIKRAMDVALKDEFNIAPEEDLVNEGDWVKMEKNFMAYALAKLTAFFALFINLDAAYRFQTQDMLGETNKENARRSARKETIRLLNIMISRTTTTIDEKFRHVRNALGAAMLFSPRLRRIIQKFLLEINVEKVGLDEADYYFCLRRTSNYRGFPLAERLRQLYLIDKEKGHQYVNIEFKNSV